MPESAEREGGGRGIGDGVFVEFVLIAYGEKECY